MPDSFALRQLLDYEPSSGIFKWKGRASGRLPFAKLGARAGCVGSSGYRYIKFQRKLYREHVLAYEIINGSVPSGVEIDHINGDRSDNRFMNLRLATHQQNLANCKNRKNNRSGRKGVSKHKGGYWRARIMVSGKELFLGLFSDIEEAAKAYGIASKTYFGEFGRTS